MGLLRRTIPITTVSPSIRACLRGMRDIFEDIFAGDPLDPMESARRNMRPNLRTRFYKEATAGKGSGGYAVMLDGRTVRTPARNPFAAPVLPIAEAIAAEWRAQEKVVDPAT